MKNIFLSMILGFSIIFFVIFSSYAFADDVMIFNFNYNNGQINLKEQIIKEGYYPDRNIESIGGYSCDLKDNSDKKLYSFNFEIPPKLYTDISDGGNVVGSVIILNETDFSFVVPYIEESKYISCYNPRGYEVLKENIQKIEMSPQKSNFRVWAVAVLTLLIIFFAFILIKKSKEEKS